MRRLIISLLMRIAIRLMNGSGHCLVAAHRLAISAPGVADHLARIARAGDAAGVIAEHVAVAVQAEQRTLH